MKREEKFELKIIEHLPEGNKTLQIRWMPSWMSSLEIPIEKIADLIEELEELDKKITLKKR